MKRAGNLWPQLTSWENLLGAALAGARGKRKRPDVARFLFDLEPNVCALRRELLTGAWVPGEYRTFRIRDPKPRMISAAPFRDRVVHHAVTRLLETVFEPRFTVSSFASRKGFGQHKALHKAQAACCGGRRELGRGTDSKPFLLLCSPTKTRRRKRLLHIDTTSFNRFVE